MIVEIGTSDFRTNAGVKDGLFIEPVKYYFDRLPECNKENVAISDKEGEIEIYYLTDEEINKYNLPQWIRGCNSVGKIHPTTEGILKEKGLKNVVRCDNVKVVRIKSMLEKHNIGHIELLKVDTEGHDCVIINDYLNTVDFLPEQILFENNQLSNKEEVLTLVKRLESLGYECEYLKNDVIATL